MKSRHVQEHTVYLQFSEQELREAVYAQLPEHIRIHTNPLDITIAFQVPTGGDYSGMVLGPEDLPMSVSVAWHEEERDET